MKKLAVYLEAVPEGGGYFQYAQILLEALSELPGGTFDILCLYTHEKWRDYLEGIGLPGRPVPGRGAFSGLGKSIAKRLLRVGGHSRQYSRKRFAQPNAAIASWNPDILLSPQPKMFFLPAKIRQIAPIHDLMHIYEPRFPEVGDPEESARRDAVFSAMVRDCSAVLVDSPLGAEHVREQYGALPGQTLVLPYAAPQSLLDAGPVRPEAELPAAFLFYPAQFWPHKNHLGLLDALALARKEAPDIHCVFSGSVAHAGYAPFTARIAALNLAGNVSVVGYVREVELAWLYKNARGLVMPTFFGPTNIPPLEAMALGCPAAVSDIYAMRWQCEDAALYFNPESVEEIATAILDLWSNEALREELRRKGLCRHTQWNAGTMKAAFQESIRTIAHEP